MERQRVCFVDKTNRKMTITNIHICCLKPLALVIGADGLLAGLIKLS